MYHVSAQGIDERMINVHYYYWARGQNGIGNESPGPPPSLLTQPLSSVRACALLAFMLLYVHGGGMTY